MKIKQKVLRTLKKDMVKNGERSSFFKHIYELKNECENELGTFKNGEFVDV